MRRLLHACALTLALAAAANATAGDGGSQGGSSPRGDEIRALMAKEETEEAERRARSWIAELDRNGGGDSLEAADRMDLLLDILRGEKAKASQALPWAQRVADIRRALDPGSAPCAKSLQSLAVLLFRSGRLLESAPLLEQALAMQEKAADARDSDTASMLADLGPMLGSLGDWSGSRRVYERAAEIYEKSTGWKPFQSRVLLFNLGDLLEHMGDFEAVRELNQRLLRAASEGSGLSPLVRVRALSRIVEMDHLLGEDDRARRDYQQMLTLWDGIRDRPEILSKVGAIELANTWARLATGASIIGDLSTAREDYLHALDVRTGFLGPEHGDLSWDLHRLGSMLMSAGKPREALPYLERACRIQLDHDDSRLNDSAGCLMDEAAVVLATGDVKGALQISRRSVDAARDPRCGDQMSLINSLDSEARILAAAGKLDEARRRALEAEALERRMFQQYASSISEREALRFENHRMGSLDVGLSTLFMAPGRDPGATAIEEVWDQVVLSRSMVLDELAARKHVIASAHDTGMESLLLDLDTARSRLAHLFVRGPEGEGTGGFSEVVRSLSREKEAAERELAARSRAFRASLERQRTGWSDVRRAIPPGAALVAYVRYKRLVRAGEAWNDVPSYAAFVLGADRAGPRAIDLGDAESVDTLASRWREAASNPPPRGLASDDRRGGDAYADVAGPLRRAIWDPLERSLEGASLVLVVADGALLQVNLPALPDDAGRFLVESRRTIHQIFAERDLARGGGTAAGANALLALGGADYGDPGAGATGLVATKAAVATPIVAPADGVPPHRPFDPLPGTRQEAMAIGELWREKGAAGRGGKTILLLGRDASESTFKRRAGEARVLHLATHAFFPWEKILDRAGRSSPGAVSSNPLMGSGLAFAGANAGASTGAAGDDGVLLGEEIASLDLSSVEWVVLSACGTGLGTIQEREGVLGLRRAFQEAGAATIISSLWEVEDRSTLAWMLSLYRARLSGRSTSDSMRQASLDFLADARSNGRSTHPYYWGAFVAVGDWR